MTQKNVYPEIHQEKKILFCIPGLVPDASGILFLNVMKKFPGINITIKPYYTGFNPSEIDEHQLVFCVREIRGYFTEIVNYALDKGIKTAYAVDDNLFEIARMVKGYENFFSPKIQNVIKTVDYLICTNQNLADYYRHINERIVLWPANTSGEELPLTPNTVENQFIIGYFGNPRDYAFQEITPALQKVLTARPHTEFLSAGVDLNKFNLPCRYVPFNLDYQQALAQLKEYRPHILIAPDSIFYKTDLQNRNLDYKNVVKFLDATKLGAVLVASKIGPYKYLDVEHGLITLVNDSEQWFHALLHLIDDLSFRESLFSRARNYILENHDSTKIANQIEKQLIF